MTKRNSISVPDGYFQNLEQRLQQIPNQRVNSDTPHGIRRLAPYVAYAASLAMLLALGNLIFRQPAATEEYGWDYVSYLTRSLDPDGLVELKETEELSDDEIRSYLLASNVSIEQLNYVNNEEAY